MSDEPEVQATPPDPTIRRVFEHKRGRVLLSYDPEATTEESVTVDLSGPCILTLDESMQMLAFFTDFAAIARSVMQKPLPQAEEPANA